MLKGGHDNHGDRGMRIDIDKLFAAGAAKLTAEFSANEKMKVGTLRVGNTGLMLDDGRIVGSCPRLTYLRKQGINVEEADYSRELMFEAGRSNEDLWMKVLKQAWTSGPILAEEAIPAKWFTSRGTPVTGRPDLVLCESAVSDEGVLQTKPLRGIELKLVSSVWTARDVLGNNPKPPHLMQAAHYSWQLGIPFDLWYTSRADFAVMGWAQKHFPKMGSEGSYACQYDDKGIIKKVLPFRKGFHLRIDSSSGILYYKPIGLDVDGKEYPEQPTIVTVNAIRNYYEHIDSIDSTGDFGPPPENLKGDGSKMNWSAGDYCSLGENCCFRTKIKDKDQWVQAVKAELGK